MFEAQIEHTEPMTVAFLAAIGPYDQIPQGFATLYGWLTQRGLIPEGMPHGVFLSPPDVPAEQVHWELWAPVSGNPDEVAANEGGLGIKHVEPHMVATTTHIGPYDTVGPTYGSMMEWIAEHGYTVVGPPHEVYVSDPEKVPPDETVTQILMPVAPIL